MPFTFSHPAVILPATYLDKKYYCLSALIIGSMTPDFEYFIRMRDFSARENFTHDPAAVAVVCFAGKFDNPVRAVLQGFFYR